MELCLHVQLVLNKNILNFANAQYLSQIVKKIITA